MLADNDIDDLSIDFIPEDDLSTTFQDQCLQHLGSDTDDEIKWIPSILKPLPFWDLFSLYSQYTLASSTKKKEKSFSGAHYPSLKNLYFLVKQIKKSLPYLQEEFVQKFVYDNYRGIFELVVLGKQNQGQNFFGKHVLKDKFSSSREKRQFQEKQVVVRAFCNRDYGTQALETEIEESKYKVKVFKVHYKRLLLSVIADTLRKMEHFLINQCENQIINKFNRNQIKSLFYPLAHCRKYFSNQVCQIFYKMMKIMVGIGGSAVSQIQVKTFYTSIQDILKTISIDRGIFQNWKKTRANDPLSWKKLHSWQNIYSLKERYSFRLHEIWNSKYEHELLDIYSQTSNFQQISTFFKKCYPQHAVYFKKESLIKRFHKIILISIQAILQQMDKKKHEEDFPFQKLSKYEIKMLIQQSQALEIRNLILRYYHGQIQHLNEYLENIAELIQSFLIKKRKQMQQIEQIEAIIWKSMQKRWENEDTQDYFQKMEDKEVKIFGLPCIEVALISGWLDPEYQ